MKTSLLILATLFCAFTLNAATVTGRSAKAPLTGAEEFPINDAGVDKKVTAANILYGLTITATTGTLTIANDKILAASNSLTLAGTDGTTMTFPGTSQTIVGLTSQQTLTNKTLTAPIMTTPTLGVASATTVNKITLTAPATGATLTLTDGKTLAVTNSLTLAGTDSTTFTFPPTTATVFTSSLASNNIGAANSVWGASNALVFEGSSADGSETTISATNPTAARTITLPDAAGTVALSQASTAVALTSDNQAVTPGAASRIQLSSDSETATARTFTLSATGAITGQIYIVVAPATNNCEIAATGIQKLSATWSPNAFDTLTLMFDGTNFLELARSAN
jgi:hypothetical protein